jgi:hypothetical protein
MTPPTPTILLLALRLITRITLEITKFLLRVVSPLHTKEDECEEERKLSTPDLFNNKIKLRLLNRFLFNKKLYKPSQ